MLRNSSSRTLVVLVALAGVLAVVTFVTRAGLSAGAPDAGQTQTFLEQFVVAGGPIVWFVLLPMSVVTVYLVVEYSLSIRGKKLLPGDAGTAIIETVRQFGPGQLEEKIGDRSDVVTMAVVRAVRRGRGDWFRMRSLLFESLEEQALRLLRRIEWLNLVGNVSPMVGLFGTVFGMIKLFNAIVTAGGQPQPAQLAEGISVALVTTFWGLLIAIPALALHGVFRNRIETLVSRATTEAESILPQIILCVKKAQGATQPMREQAAARPAIREVAGKRDRPLRQSPTTQ
jgi:biopolymer transport protein ExbB